MSYQRNAKGYAQSPQPKKKIAVNMPTDVFDRIAKRARHDRVSFSAKAVELLKCGLFDYEESELFDEPKTQPTGAGHDSEVATETCSRCL